MSGTSSASTESGVGASYSAAEAQDKNAEIEALTAELIHWRELALRGWAGTVDAADGADPAQVKALRAEIAAIHRTLSWRITAPLRVVRRRVQG